jgi:hypothetical protein
VCVFFFIFTHINSTNIHKNMSHHMSDDNNIITIETDAEEHGGQRRRKDEVGLQAIDILGRDGEVKRTHRFEMPAKPTRTPRPSSNKHSARTTPPPTRTPHASDMVIDIPDPKRIKASIVDNWEAFKPKKVVALIRKMYPNTATASSQLSNLKSVLKSLGDRGPPEEYLAKLRLTRAEYKKLHDEYRTKRDQAGHDLRVIHDTDALVERTLVELGTSSDFRLLWPFVVLTSGLRPVEILTCSFQPTPQSTNHIHSSFWVSISDWAKKPDGANFARDHPLLCPSWLWCRAVRICRAYFCKEKLTKRQYSQRYSKYMLTLLRKGFPNLHGVTHVLLRRLYARYAFLYFRDDFPTVISITAFITNVLGHISSEVSLSYINLHLRNAGKLKLFEVGKSLQVPVSPASPKRHDKRRTPRKHTNLADRKV